MDLRLHVSLKLKLHPASIIIISKYFLFSLFSNLRHKLYKSMSSHFKFIRSYWPTLVTISNYNASFKEFGLHNIVYFRFIKSFLYDLVCVSVLYVLKKKLILYFHFEVFIKINHIKLTVVFNFSSSPLIFSLHDSPVKSLHYDKKFVNFSLKLFAFLIHFKFIFLMVWSVWLFI